MNASTEDAINFMNVLVKPCRSLCGYSRTPKITSVSPLLNHHGRTSLQIFLTAVLIAAKDNTNCPNQQNACLDSESSIQQYIIHGYMYQLQHTSCITIEKKIQIVAALILNLLFVPLTVAYLHCSCVASSTSPVVGTPSRCAVVSPRELALSFLVVVGKLKGSTPHEALRPGVGCAGEGSACQRSFSSIVCATSCKDGSVTWGNAT